MKKIIVALLLIVLVPYFIVTTFVKDEEIKFHIVSNRMVRVKREQTGEIVNIPFEEYIKGEEICMISQEEFVDCTEENLRKILLEQ